MARGSNAVDTVSPVVLPRDLTPAEQARLEVSIERITRLLAPLGAPSATAAWQQLREAGQTADLEGPRSVGVAIGTILLDADPEARWVSCPGPRGWTPGVVSSAQPWSPVLVVADALSRWPDAGADWVEPYVVGALDHLRSRITLGEDRPWIATPDDLPFPPVAQVRELAATALELGLSLAGDEPRAFAVLPGASGPVSATAPGDPTDRPAVRLWAREWAEQSMTPILAVAWVEPPRGSARHSAGRAGSVVVEANEAGRRGMTVAHEFVTSPGRNAPVGQPVIVADCDPII